MTYAFTKPFRCHACGKRFETQQGLGDHTRAMHPPEKAGPPPIVGIRPGEPEWIVPRCVECGKVASLTDGQSIYPHRPDLYEKRFYLCGCGAYVGCHPGTEKPLGYPCGATTRRWRSEAHAAFDPIWRGKHMNRAKAYAWLADQLGMAGADCHIGMMNEQQARQVVIVARAFLERRAA